VQTVSQYKSNTYSLTPYSRVLLEKLTGFAANQEIPHISWNPKVHYRTHKRPHLACEYYIRFCFSRGGVVSTSNNAQAGGPPLVGCPRLLIPCIRSCPPYRRPFLHPQPEDARGDRTHKTRIRAIIITYSDNVLLSCYPANNAHALCCHLWPVQLYNICSKLSHKRQHFRGGKRIIEHKRCVLISSTSFVPKICHFTRELSDISKI
jgi:hypothetical protein